jgi:hypothetical protein
MSWKVGLMPDSVRKPLPTYTQLLWNKIFEVSTINESDPVKAFIRLECLIPLLPINIQKEVKPMMREFKLKLKNAEEEMKKVYDHITTELTFRKYARKEMRKFVIKALEKISDSLESMGLKFKPEETI